METRKSFPHTSNVDFNYQALRTTHVVRQLSQVVGNSVSVVAVISVANVAHFNI